MLTRPHLTTLRTASILPLLLLAPGCGDRGGTLAPEGVSPAVRAGADAAAVLAVRAGPPSAAPRLGIYRRIWPHEDGRSWTYGYVSRTWDGGAPQFYPTPGEVPILTLDEAASLLENGPIGSDPITSSGIYGLRFNGEVTTLSGVTAQNLEESLVEGAGAVARAASRPGRSFLKLLRQARPDLAAKLAVRGVAPASAAGVSFLPDPTLLHGYAWRQTEDWIGNYGDVNQQVSWIYLTSHLETGSEFRLQLVPDLADDVYLDGRVLGPRRVTTDAGVFRHAYEVLYLVDFGVSSATDLDGNPLGYFRSYLFGTIDYAPGVGPVQSYERFHLYFGGGLGAPTGDIALTLTATGAGSRLLTSR